MERASLHILRCSDGSLHVGITRRSVEERVSEHRAEKVTSTASAFGALQGFSVGRQKEAREGGASFDTAAPRPAQDEAGEEIESLFEAGRVSSFRALSLLLSRIYL